jgi:hypothetical protein
VFAQVESVLQRPYFHSFESWVEIRSSSGYKDKLTRTLSLRECVVQCTNGIDQDRRVNTLILSAGELRGASY